MIRIIAASTAVGLLAVGASAQIRITEWMYQGANLEFIEFTNIGNSPIDMNGWSYDDDSRTPGSTSLSAFGIVAPGESVLLVETTEVAFRTAWNLPASIKIIAEFTNNLGRNDEINVYNADFDLVDRLTYGDQAFPGSIRTQNRSGVPLSLAALGANDVYQWGFANSVPGGGPYDLSGIAGANGFLVSTGGDIGNPGYFIPAPGAFALAGIAGLAVIRRRRA